MRIAILSNRKLNIILHLMAWTIIVIIPRFLLNKFGDGNTHFLYQFYANTAIYGILFYINYLFLVPRYFFRDNKVWYFLIAAGVIIILYVLMWYINENVFYDHEREHQMEQIMQEIDKGKNHIKPPIKQFKIYNYFYTSILVCGFSLGLGVFDKLSQNEKERKELEKEKLNSELAFLKNQISPHFFFNTLNNIYSLIGIDTQEAQEAVLKLSKLMRYLLYESEHGESKLQDEINFMNNYIDLMKLRLSDKVALTVSFPENTGNIAVPPLLFIPFIENAFKHGISYREHSYIDIQMSVSEKQILFISKNSIGTSSHADDGQYSGIGLENVKKRLALLYPDTHKLKIEKTNDAFSIDLQLKLKPKVT